MSKLVKEIMKKVRLLFEEIYEDASSSQEMINRVKELLSVF